MCGESNRGRGVTEVPEVSSGTGLDWVSGVVFVAEVGPNVPRLLSTVPTEGPLRDVYVSCLSPFGTRRECVRCRSSGTTRKPLFPSTTPEFGPSGSASDFCPVLSLLPRVGLFGVDLPHVLHGPTGVFRFLTRNPLGWGATLVFEGVHSPPGPTEFRSQTKTVSGP